MQRIALWWKRYRCDHRWVRTGQFETGPFCGPMTACEHAVSVCEKCGNEDWIGREGHRWFGIGKDAWASPH